MSSKIKREIKAELRSPPSMSADESSPSKTVNRQQQKKSATMVQIKAERISTPPVATLPPLSPSKLITEKAANCEKEHIRTSAGTGDFEMDEGEEEAIGTEGHEQAAEESTSMGMDAMTVKQRRRMRQAARRARRKSVSKSAEPPPIGSIQIQPAKPKQAKISYFMAKQYLKDSLVVEMVEHRHITLGWQHAGNMASIIRRLMAVTIGQYRSQVEGVPIAIGDVRVIKPLYIIGDHNCMNVDVDVQMIVLKVQPGEPVPGEGVKEIVCHASSILENKCALGTAYGNLTMTCTPAPTNVDESKMFKARFMGVQFRNANCQIKCAPLGHRRFNQ